MTAADENGITHTLRFGDVNDSVSGQYLALDEDNVTVYLVTAAKANAFDYTAEELAADTVEAEETAEDADSSLESGLTEETTEASAPIEADTVSGATVQ